jgi:hypothetical protein
MMRALDFNHRAASQVGACESLAGLVS